MNHQISFDLPIRNALGVGDFYVSSSNSAVMAQLESWQNWPDQRALLIGPRGSGKTHLAQIWAHDSGATLCGPDDAFNAINTAVVIDDAHHIGGNARAEEALFHALNHPNRALLLCARQPVRDWGIQLPDLQSRLAAIAPFELCLPDDALLLGLMGKLFYDRQILVKHKVLDYILSRIERRYDAVQDIVAALDVAALEAGGKISVQLVQKVLAQRQTADIVDAR